MNRESLLCASSHSTKPLWLYRKCSKLNMINVGLHWNNFEQLSYEGGETYKETITNIYVGWRCVCELQMNQKASYLRWVIYPYCLGDA